MKSLQQKIVAQLLLTSTLPLIAVGGITVLFIGRIAIYEARQRISNNMVIAQNIYDSSLENLKYITRDQNRRLSTLIMEDQLDLLRNEYSKTVKQYKFDFLL